MPRASAPKETETDQHARFLETACALGCDEDEAAFDEKLKAVVGPKVGENRSEPIQVIRTRK